MSVLEQSCGPFKTPEIKLPEGAKVVDRIHDEIVIEIDRQAKTFELGELKDEEQFNKVLDTVLCSSVRPKKY